MTFKDHFSGHAGAYAAHRPDRYPQELFDFLAGQAPGCGVAWDCATGNGQAAIPLSERFAVVVATDASAEQVAHFRPHSRIDVRQAPAEASGLAAGSVDLVTVAQAIHWFDFDRFYREVRRVLRPGGLIAAWSYNLLRSDPAIDRVLDYLAEERVFSYWPPERHWVSEEYRTLPFPFPELSAPPFTMSVEWTLPQLLAYVSTWSSIVRCRRETGIDALAEVEPDLEAAWGGPSERERARTLSWPLHLRLGRVEERSAA
jgi:SAM-dependent methyltransferase